MANLTRQATCRPDKGSSMRRAVETQCVISASQVHDEVCLLLVSNLTCQEVIVIASSATVDLPQLGPQGNTTVRHGKRRTAGPNRLLDKRTTGQVGRGHFIQDAVNGACSNSTDDVPYTFRGRDWRCRSRRVKYLQCTMRNA